MSLLMSYFSTASFCNYFLCEEAPAFIFNRLYTHNAPINVKPAAGGGGGEGHGVGFCLGFLSLG